MVQAEGSVRAEDGKAGPSVWGLDTTEPILWSQSHMPPVRSTQAMATAQPILHMEQPSKFHSLPSHGHSPHLGLEVGLTTLVAARQRGEVMSVRVSKN